MHLCSGPESGSIFEKILCTVIIKISVNIVDSQELCDAIKVQVHIIIHCWFYEMWLNRSYTIRNSCSFSYVLASMFLSNVDSI